MKTKFLFLVINLVVFLIFCTNVFSVQAQPKAKPGGDWQSGHYGGRPLDFRYWGGYGGGARDHFNKRRGSGHYGGPPLDFRYWGGYRGGGYGSADRYGGKKGWRQPNRGYGYSPNYGYRGYGGHKKYGVKHGRRGGW